MTLVGRLARVLHINFLIVTKMALILLFLKLLVEVEDLENQTVKVLPQIRFGSTLKTRPLILA
jgi:hypothetical protein